MRDIKVKLRNQMIFISMDGEDVFYIEKAKRMSMGFLDVFSYNSDFEKKTTKEEKEIVFALCKEKIEEWVQEKNLKEVWILIEKKDSYVRPLSFIKSLGFQVKKFPEEYKSFLESWCQVTTDFKKIGCMTIDKDVIKKENTFVEEMRKSMKELKEEGYIIFQDGDELLSGFEVYYMGEEYRGFYFWSDKGTYYVSIDDEVVESFKEKNEIKNAIKNVLETMRKKHRLTELFEDDKATPLFHEMLCRVESSDWVEKFWREMRKTRSAAKIDEICISYLDNEKEVDKAKEIDGSIIVRIQDTWYSLILDADVVVQGQTKDELIEQMLNEKRRLYQEKL